MQTQLDAGVPFVLWVPVAQQELGWLHAHALLAERIYDRSLRSQLLEWGWRPYSLDLTTDAIVTLARRNLRRIQPNGVTAESARPATAVACALWPDQPDPDDGYLLDPTVNAAGLPAPATEKLPTWRRRALARLLATQAHVAAPAVGAGHPEWVIAPPQQALALRLLEQWTDSFQASEGLPDAIIGADALAGLGGLVNALQASDGSVYALFSPQNDQPGNPGVISLAGRRTGTLCPGLPAACPTFRKGAAR